MFKRSQDRTILTQISWVWGKSRAARWFGPHFFSPGLLRKRGWVQSRSGHIWYDKGCNDI